MLTLIWREQARQNVKQAVEYIAEYNVAAADRLEAAILARAERVLHHSFMYRAGRVPDAREAVIHPNYVMIYRIMDDAVEIVSLMHTRQQYP